MATLRIIVDFGATCSCDASYVVTGLTGIAAGDYVEAWLDSVDSADHSSDEHDPTMIQVWADRSTLVPGVGVTVRAKCTDGMGTTGQYNVNLAWTPAAGGTGTVVLSGDVSGPSGTNTVNKIQGRAVSSSAPPDGALLRWSASNNRWDPVSYPGEVTPAGGVTINSGTAVANVDTTVFTVPSAPAGAGKFVCTGYAVRVSTALTGGGTITMTAGLLATGTDFIPSKAITSGSLADTNWGQDYANDLGSAFASAKRYQATLSPGDTFILRLAVGSGVSTQLTLVVRVFGYWI